MKYFLAVVAAEDVKREKPAPDGFLLAVKMLQVDPQNCVVIEDAEKGIIAAKDAGMRVIAITNGKTSHNGFSRADLVIENIKLLMLSNALSNLQYSNNLKAN